MRNTRKCNLTLIRMLKPSSFRILDLSDMLLDVILETHAWAAARPKHEHQSEVHKLENQISEVMEREKEQGMCPSESSSLYSSVFLGMLRLPMPWILVNLDLDSLNSLAYHSFRCFFGDAEKTREKLSNFVQHMKTALAALTSQML